MSCPSSIKPLNNASKGNLLPLQKRPRKLLSLKKRPQSALHSLSSATTTASSSDSFSSSLSTSSSSSSDGLSFVTALSSSPSISLSSSDLSLSSSLPYSTLNQQKRTKVRTDDYSKPTVAKAISTGRPTSWVLGESIHCLSDVPLFHISPLTRLELEYGNNDTDNNTCSPNLIASRIEQCVVSMSAIGYYNSQMASATIHTMDHIILSIQLFKSQDCKKIFIEIERKKGDTMKFHRIAHMVLNALKQQQSNKDLDFGRIRQEDNNEDNNHDSKNLEQEKQHYISSMDQSNVLKFQEAMERVCNLLKKDRMDAMLLGMESLCFLTNGQSSNQEITYQAAQSVLQSGVWQVANDCIFRLLGSYNTNSINDDHEYTFSTSSSAKEEDTEHEQKMKHMALKILANCLSFMVRHHEQDMKMILNENINDWTNLLLNLVSLMKCNKADLQDIFQAAKSIHYLISSSAQMKVVAKTSDVFGAALDYQNRENSNCSHPCLSEVSRNIISVLNHC